jgi:hypothetical protein
MRIQNCVDGNIGEITIDMNGSSGINLTAEFSKTPFDSAFFQFMEGVATKQARETNIIKK